MTRPGQRAGAGSGEMIPAKAPSQHRAEVKVRRYIAFGLGGALLGLAGWMFLPPLRIAIALVAGHSSRWPAGSAGNVHESLPSPKGRLKPVPTAHRSTLSNPHRYLLIEILRRRGNFEPGSNMSGNRTTARQRKAQKWARDLMRDVRRVLAHHPDADPGNVRHTLILLQLPPLERLGRSLTRGRTLAQRKRT